MSMGASAAFSHVTLQDQAAAARRRLSRCVLRVGHGCAEGAATTSIHRQSSLHGFNGAQPLVKAWLDCEHQGRQAGPHPMKCPRHQVHRRRAGNHLDCQQRALRTHCLTRTADEFVFRGTTPKKPGTLWFKVVQGCDQGCTNAWVEIPCCRPRCPQPEVPRSPFGCAGRPGRRRLTPTDFLRGAFYEPFSPLDLVSRLGCRTALSMASGAVGPSRGCAKTPGLAPRCKARRPPVPS